MALRLQLEVLGETQIDRTFLRLSDTAKNMEPLWERFLKELRDIARLQFESEGSYGSGGWPALAESTIESKQSRGKDNGILRASNDLFNSLTSEGPGSIADISKEWLRYGTSIPYAGFHQSGTTNMPQRRVVRLPESERRMLVSLMQRYLVTGEI